MNSQILALSDQHFGSIQYDEGERLHWWLSFVRLAIAQESVEVVICGDFFDFWFENGGLIPGRLVPVLQGFQRLKEAGVPVTVLSGNHEFMSLHFLSEHYGCTLGTSLVRRMKRGGVLFLHGDRLQRDMKHRLQRWVMTFPLFQFLYKLLPPLLSVPFAQKVSRMSRVSHSAPSTTQRAFFKNAALKELRKHELSAVVMGHLHSSELDVYSDGEVYANCGSWLDAPTIIRVAGEQVERCLLITGDAPRIEIIESVQLPQ